MHYDKTVGVQISPNVSSPEEKNNLLCGVNLSLLYIPVTPHPLGGNSEERGQQYSLVSTSLSSPNPPHREDGWMEDLATAKLAETSPPWGSGNEWVLIQLIYRETF